MHTEDEAKKLWCPHVQVSISTGIDGTEHDDNRQSLDMDFNRSPVCIASRCMAWRWVTSEKWARDLERAAGHGAGKAERGYCGLAGKP